MEEEHAHEHIGPASVRLLHGPIPQQASPDSSRVWIYQHRASPGADWVPMYCFVDFEFLPEDIRGMNLSPWRSPRSFFTRRVLVTRFTTDMEELPAADGSAGSSGRGRGRGRGGANGGGDEQQGQGQDQGPGLPDEEAITHGEIDGAIVLFEDTLKWRRRGETRLEVKFGTEEERIDALRKYFGIVLDEEDRDAIRGTVSEISNAW